MGNPPTTSMTQHLRVEATVVLNDDNITLLPRQGSYRGVIDESHCIVAIKREVVSLATVRCKTVNVHGTTC